MFSRAINKVNARDAGELPVTLLALTKVFLNKCSNLKEHLRSKMRKEISKTSNLITRILIEREPVEGLGDISDHIQSMCIEVHTIYTDIFYCNKVQQLYNDS